MKVDWTVRGARVPDEWRERVEKHLDKLDRFFRGPVQASVVVGQEGDAQGTARRLVEIVLRNRLGTFTARDESHDFADAVNAVLGRIDSQVHKAHDKRVDGRRRVLDEPWPAEVGSE